MNDQFDLKSAERKVFQLSFADGLWDVLIGCFVLQFAIAPLLSEKMGDFWSSFIFLPFWGLVYLAIRFTRKHVIHPRLGTVKFGNTRRKKMTVFTIILLGLNLLFLVLGIIAALHPMNVPGENQSMIFGLLMNVAGDSLTIIFGLMLLCIFSVAAYMLDYPRLYLYGSMLMIAPMVGEWLRSTYQASHHGYPIVYGFSSALIILTGLVTFFHFLRNTSGRELPDGA